MRRAPARAVNNIVSALAQLSSPSLSLEVEAGEALDVRELRIEEAIGSPFLITVTATSRNPDIELSEIVGKSAKVRIGTLAEEGMNGRLWSGVCRHMDLVRVEGNGLSTYRLEIVPMLWLLSQRRNYRIYQQTSDADIVLELLAEWNIEPEVRFRREDYKARRYRVQYAESDLDFVARLLEETGISWFFEVKEGASKLVLSDAPEAASPTQLPVAFVDSPTASTPGSFVTAVRLGQRVRPGSYTIRDVDYRRPAEVPLIATAVAATSDLERRLDRFHYVPGAFSYRVVGGGTPQADDKGVVRSDLAQGQSQTERRLQAKRASARQLSCTTSELGLVPGVVFSIAAHPRRELAEDKRLLVTRSVLTAHSNQRWIHDIEAHFADAPYRQPQSTPKPKTEGVETATVVGPRGEEIHTDEFGRIRVQFHWDRRGTRDDRSSCWIPVSQPWGGAGFGAVNLPRVGQEVLIDFLGGDPDRPVVIGRVFTRNQPAPYDLPRHAAVSGIRSESTPRGRSAPPRPPPSPRSSPLGHGQGLDQRAIGEVVQTSSTFGAASPDGSTHGWSGSELSFRDTAGSELTYLQAQRNFHTVVKNDRVTLVGNNDTLLVGADRINEIKNSELLKVGRDREVEVGRNMKHTVQGNITVQSVEGYESHDIKEHFAVRSKTMQLTADEHMLLRVGNSSILLTKEFIIIDAPNVYINPGAGAVAAAIEIGAPPETDAQRAERLERVAREAREAERARAQARTQSRQQLQRAWFAAMRSTSDATPSYRALAGTVAGYSTGRTTTPPPIDWARQRADLIASGRPATEVDTAISRMRGEIQEYYR